MSVSNTNRYLSTINLALIVVGYHLVTTLFLPNAYSVGGTEGGTTISRLVTVPFRATVLAVSIAVIILNWRQRIRLTLPLKLFFIFWFFLSLRIIYDLLIRIDLTVDPSIIQNEFLYTFLVSLVPAIAVLRSQKAIDYELAFQLMIGGSILFVLALYYRMPVFFSSIDSHVRQTANMALNPIFLGRASAALSLLALYWAMQSKKAWIQVIAFALMLTGIFMLFRTASRGPLLAYFCSLLFLLIARQKFPVWGVGCAIAFLLFVILFSDLLFDAVQSLSPAMADRLSLSGNVSQYQEFSNGRSALYSNAFSKFMDHPLFGDTYAIFLPDGKLWYSHNSVLDAFMGLGLFGGVLFVSMLLLAVWNAYLLINHHDRLWWVGLVCVLYIVCGQFSGNFYHDETQNALLVIILYRYGKNSYAGLRHST